MGGTFFEGIKWVFDDIATITNRVVVRTEPLTGRDIAVFACQRSITNTNVVLVNFQILKSVKD